MIQTRVILNAVKDLSVCKEIPYDGRVDKRKNK